jgi:hypothetical protein
MYVSEGESIPEDGHQSHGGERRYMEETFKGMLVLPGGNRSDIGP